MTTRRQLMGGFLADLVNMHEIDDKDPALDEEIPEEELERIRKSTAAAEKAHLEAREEEQRNRPVDPSSYEEKCPCCTRNQHRGMGW